LKYIGKYQVRGLLGRGGMGAVYKVVLPGLSKTMALKKLAPTDALKALMGMDEIRRRFITEAQTMGGLRHRKYRGGLGFP
jgi:serine/threonine protein kinase